jgi:uncharacterized membrane-anchored protein YhcB (DUF1043 family)
LIVGIKEEIKQRLDDPRVSAETKQRLLQDYADLGASDAELAPYERQLGVDVSKSGGFLGTVAAVGHAAGDLGRAQGEQLGQSWANLTDSTPSPNSDALIDDGIVGLQIFDVFYPRYTKAGGDPGGVPAGGDVGTAALDPDSLRAAADELRGIDFTAFATDAAAMDAVGKGVDDSRNHLAQAWANNLAGWTGGAAQAANQYKAKFDGAVATLDAGIKPIPGAITTASNTIQTQVTDYAKHLHNQWGDGKMAGMTPADVDAMLDARDKLPQAIQQMQQAIEELNNRSWFEKAFDFVLSIALPVVGIAVVLGVEFAKEITEDNIQEELQKAQQALQSAQDKLRQFVQDYGTKAASVHDYSQQAYQAVQESYDALFQATTGQGKLSADPFAQLGATPDFENADHQGGGGNGKGNGHVGSGGGGGGGGSTGGGGGGGSSVPSTGSGTDPSLAGAGQTVPSHTGTGLGTPGGGTDPNGTGLGGVPIGGTGGSGSESGGGLGRGGTGLPGQPKEVTIQDGKNKITVGQPDARGHSKLTVDDGKGNKKTYDLDFSGEKKDGLGADGALDGEHVQAGPDGKAVIHDGDTTITAERVPGDPNKLKMTVDDGTPPPNTYTVDFDSGAGGTSSGGAAGGGQQAAHSDTASSSTGGGSSHGGGGGGTGGGGGGGGTSDSGGGGGGGGGEDKKSRDLDAGMATKAESPGNHGQNQGAAASAGGDHAGGRGGQQGGMPMGMGGMGAGGQGGGDTTRSGSKWRTQGQLFDDDDPAASFSGIVGEDPANRVSRPTKKG